MRLPVLVVNGRAALDDVAKSGQTSAMHELLGPLLSGVEALVLELEALSEEMRKGL